MAEPGPEPGRVWRLLALCGAAVFLAAAAAGGALVAWNLAASTARGPRCPEPEQVNSTVWPPHSAPEVEELRRRLAEAEQSQESLVWRLQRAEGDRMELEAALKTCKDHQVGAGETDERRYRTPLAPPTFQNASSSRSLISNPQMALAPAIEHKEKAQNLGPLQPLCWVSVLPHAYFRFHQFYFERETLMSPVI